MSQLQMIFDSQFVTTYIEYGVDCCPQST